MPAQSFPRHKLRNEEDRLVLASEVEHADNIRMRKRGRRLCLALKAATIGSVISQVARENFDGDIAFQASIASFVHLAHAATTDERDHFVSSEARARRDSDRPDL